MKTEGPLSHDDIHVSLTSEDLFHLKLFNQKDNKILNMVSTFAFEEGEGGDLIID